MKMIRKAEKKGRYTVRGKSEKKYMSKRAAVYFRLLLALVMIISTFTGCSEKKQEEETSDASGKQVVSLAWSNVQDSVSYNSTITALEAAGGTVKILDMIKSTDLDYTEDGKLVNAADEHGFLSGEAARLVKENTWHHSNVEEVLGDVDCVVVPGGWDISPTLYKEPQGWHGIKEDSDFSPERDVSDYILISYCLDNDIPMLCICRGMQMLSVVSGGEMVQDIPKYFSQIGAEYQYEHRDPERKIFTAHSVTVSEDSLFYKVVGKKQIENAPSWHHQAVLSVKGTPLSVVGTYDTDGVEMIEAVENQKLTFCLGVQFHPEVAVAKVLSKSEDAGNYTDYDTSLTFFNAIIEAGRNRNELINKCPKQAITLLGKRVIEQCEIEKYL